MIKKFKDFIIEGVADKFAEKEFGITSDDHGDVYSKYHATNKDGDELFNFELFDDVYKVIKNPTSLEMIDSNVRGIIDKNGNIYLLVKRNSVTHTILIMFLVNEGIIQNVEDWHIQLPTEFVTITRKGNTNTFYLGESNETMYTDEMRKYLSNKDKLPPYDITTKEFQLFLDKAKLKNPKYNFKNELEITENY